MRAAVNFRCQRSNQQGVWAPVNCGSRGLILLYEDGREKGGGSYDFGSTGPDGTITIYPKWVELGACKPYWTDLSIHQITMRVQPANWAEGRCFRRRGALCRLDGQERVRNGFLVFSNGSYRAYVDHRLQVARHPTCPDLIRAAANFRCQRSTQHGWIPVNCGSAGTITVQKSGSAPLPRDMDSAVPVRTERWGELDIVQVTINNQVQFRSGDGGRSDALRDC